jgi:hypothetical protein
LQPSMQLPQRMHLNRSIRQIFFSLSTIIAPVGHLLAQKVQRDSFDGCHLDATAGPLKENRLPHKIEGPVHLAHPHHIPRVTIPPFRGIRVFAAVRMAVAARYLQSASMFNSAQGYRTWGRSCILRGTKPYLASGQSDKH